jgi:hypothetical protein
VKYEITKGSLFEALQKDVDTLFVGPFCLGAIELSLYSIVVPVVTNG